VEQFNFRECVDGLGYYKILGGGKNWESTRIILASNLAHFQQQFNTGWFGGEVLESITLCHPNQFMSYYVEGGVLVFPTNTHFLCGVVPEDMRGIKALRVNGDLMCSNCLDLGDDCDLEVNGELAVSPNVLRCRNLTARRVVTNDVVEVKGCLDVDHLSCRMVIHNGFVIDDELSA
jgi:hypothetical protein